MIIYQVREVEGFLMACKSKSNLEARRAKVAKKQAEQRGALAKVLSGKKKSIFSYFSKKT